MCGLLLLPIKPTLTTRELPSVLGTSGPVWVFFLGWFFHGAVAPWRSLLISRPPSFSSSASSRSPD